MPKKILILAMGSSGDVHPMIALALALRARGHEITFAVNPHFFPLLAQHHIPTLPIGTEELYHRAMEAVDLWNPTKAFPFILKEFILPSLPDTFTLVANTHPDLVIGTPLSLGARIAHDKLHIPYATVLLAPAPLISADHPPTFPPLLASWNPRWYAAGINWLLNFLLDRWTMPGVNAFRATHGLPPIDHVVTRYWHSPQLILGLFPEAFLGHPRPTDWPAALHLTGFPLYDERDLFPLDPAVEAFLQAGPPPIIFTPGSAMTQAHDFFAASAQAIQNLNARAIFLTKFPHQIPPSLPSTIRHFPFIPLSRILPRSAALVCHGGIGTISQALAAGIPQLIMPMAHDQPDNAARIKRLGVGLALPRKKYRTPAVTRALAQLLSNPTYKTHAQQLATQITQSSTHALADACHLLENLFLRPKGAESM